MLIDLVNEALVVNALAPVVLAASAQGSSKDFKEAKISTNAIISVGVYGVNTTNAQVQIEESADGSTNWAAIPGMVQSAITQAGQYLLRGQRTYRYIRANAISVQGTTPSVALNVSVLGEKEYVGSPAGGYSIAPAG